MSPEDSLIEGIVKYPHHEKRLWDLAEGLISVLAPYGEVRVYVNSRLIYIDLCALNNRSIEVELHARYSGWSRVRAEETMIHVCGGGELKAAEDILPHLGWCFEDPPTTP
jgi:hypothetical protein